MAGKKKPRSRPRAKRNYPRTARLNSLMQQIIAGYFERVNDDKLDFFTITGVEVDSDLNKARVFVSTLDDDDYDNNELLVNLAKHRISIQSEINKQSHMRKTPEVVFEFDPAIREGARIEQILKKIQD